MVAIIEKNGVTLMLDCKYTSVKTFEDAANNGWQIIGYVKRAN